MNNQALPVPSEEVPTFIKLNITFYSIMDATTDDLDKFFNDVTRDELILWLSWNDPNGIYTDSESYKEFGSIMSREEGLQCMKNQLMNQ